MAGKKDDRYTKPYQTDIIYSNSMRKKGQPPTLATANEEDVVKRLKLIAEIGTTFKDYKVSNISFEGNIMDGGKAIETGTKKEKNIMYA